MCYTYWTSSRVSDLEYFHTTANRNRFAPINLDAKSGGPDYPNLIDSLTKDDKLRIEFLKACLSKLGLHVSKEVTSMPSLSALHISSLHNIEASQVFKDLKEDVITEDGDDLLKGENDTFLIEKQEPQLSLDSLASSLPYIGSDRKDGATADQLASGVGDQNIDYNNVVKRLIFHESSWPGSKETPHFNHDLFYSNLAEYQDESGSRAEEFGKIIMYGEVMTSTNTILEKYV
jgi:biotin--protein ligase